MAACVLALLAAGCTSQGGVPDRDAAGGRPPVVGAPAVVPSALGDFRVAVDHEQSPAPGPAGAGKLAWRTTWRLSWAPVPGATSYAVHYGTNEGAGGGPGEVRSEPELQVDAAAGTSTQAALDLDRDAALLFTSSQLLVSVSARSDAGEGPRSLWFPVGDVPPTGRPIGSRSLGEQSDG